MVDSHLLHPLHGPLPCRRRRNLHLDCIPHDLAGSHVRPIRFPHARAKLNVYPFQLDLLARDRRFLDFHVGRRLRLLALGLDLLQPERRRGGVCMDRMVSNTNRSSPSKELILGRLLGSS
jgi:hypothetical protein